MWTLGAVNCCEQEAQQQSPFAPLSSSMSKILDAFLSMRAQRDVHIAELTVRETLDFSSRCQGVGHKRQELQQLMEREAKKGIVPDPEIDAFMKVSSQQNPLAVPFWGRTLCCSCEAALVQAQVLELQSSAAQWYAGTVR